MTEPLTPPLRSTGLVALSSLAVYVLLAGLHWWEMHTPCGWNIGSTLGLAAFVLQWTPWLAWIWLFAVTVVWATGSTRAKIPAKTDLVLWVSCGLALFALYGIERATRTLPMWLCDPF
jgi:hypothetical protein